MDTRAGDGSRRVGKYKLIRELGRGGMGVVYLAEDSRLLRQVALKVLHPALMLDASFVERFASEAQAIAALTHPGIVHVHTFEEVDGSHLIDMEYVDGHSLDKILARGMVGLGDALDIMAQMMEALAACHARGMVHRDIKPSNILVAYDGRVMLSDFGLARSCALTTASAATSSCFIGTPKYAPPESWERATPTPAGDVYSAGLVMLELLAGKTPFDGDSPLEIMRKTIASKDIPVRTLLPDISGELTGLLEDMLRAKPEKRPADAEVAYRRFRETPEFIARPEGGATTMRITPPALRMRLPRLRRGAWRWPALAALIIMAVLAGGVGWQLITTPTEGTDAQAGAPPVSEDTARDAVPVVPAVTPNVSDLAAVGDKVVFVGNTGAWRTLWSYDTQTGATTPIWPKLNLSLEDRIAAVQPVNGGIVGLIRGERHGLSLFRTDGTAEGTLLLSYAASIHANRIELLGAHEGKAYFNRIGGDETFGLWETDGTIEGTRHRWGDITANTVTGLMATPEGGLYFASQTTGSFFYWPPGAREPYSLWPETPDPTRVEGLFVVGDRVLVEGDASLGEGRELWIGGPEPGSLRPLYNFMPGSNNGLTNPSFAPFRNGVVFVAETPGHGREIWFSDGTEAGTCLIYDVNPGGMSSNPYRFTESGGLLYFSALTAEEGQELWVTDGTAEGTRMVKDIRPGLESTDPYAFCPFQEGLLFTPHDAVAGEELWFTDGTAEGTRLLYDCLPGPDSGSPHGTLVIGSKAYFAAGHPDYGRVLWETDGTPEGTRPVLTGLDAARPSAPTTTPWVTFQGRLYVVNTTPGLGAELWVTDPVSAQTRLVRDIYPGPEGSHPGGFLEFQDQLYFAADDGIHGRELWLTDGTREGTVLVMDLSPGPASGNPHALVRWGDNSFAFSALGPLHRGHGIYYYNGTERTVKLAGGTDERGDHWRPTALADGGDGWLLFSTQNATGDTTLWRTDGTTTIGLPALGRGDSR